MSVRPSLFGHRSTEMPQAWSCLRTHVLLLPNPKLAALSIWVVEQPRLPGAGLARPYSLPADMLNSDPGALTTLTLQNVSLFEPLEPASRPTIPALTHLRTFNYAAMGGTLRELELRFIVGMLPELENLGLGFQAFELEPDHDDAGLPTNRIHRVA